MSWRVCSINRGETHLTYTTRASKDDRRDSKVSTSCDSLFWKPTGKASLCLSSNATLMAETDAVSGRSRRVKRLIGGARFKDRDRDVESRWGQPSTG